MGSAVTDEGPAISTTYLLAEDDYRYGVGPLLVRVTKVLEPAEFGDGDLWWLVEAICKHPQISGPGHHRTLYVRATSLKNARQT
jgi:hypothetical protein